MSDPRLPEGTTQADIDEHFGEPPVRKERPRPARREWVEDVDGPAADRYADEYFSRLYEPRY